MNQTPFWIRITIAMLFAFAFTFLIDAVLNDEYWRGFTFGSIFYFTLYVYAVSDSKHKIKE